MATGKLTSYDLTNGVIVDMSDSVYFYTPMQLPLTGGVGTDGLSVLSSENLTQVSFSWQDETGLSPRSTLAATLTTGDTLIFQLASGDRLKFSTGDVLTVRKAGAAETMRVVGYSATTADTLLVSRALTGTATNYASGAVVIGMGTALAEGSDPEDFRAIDRTTRTNNSQIFGPTAIYMTGTGRVVPRYGVPDEWAHQLALRTYENRQQVEQALLYGMKYNSTTTKIRAMGGLAEFLSTNTDSTSTQFTIVKINTNLQTVYNQGGEPDRVLVNPGSLGDLNDSDNTTRVRTTMVETARGRRPVAYVETEYGDLTIVRNRWVHPYDAFFIQRDLVTRKILRPLQFEMLAKTGDADKGQIVAEESVKVVGERHMLRMSNLTSYTAA